MACEYNNIINNVENMLSKLSANQKERDNIKPLIKWLNEAKVIGSSNENFDKDLDTKLRNTLTKLYPEIKLEYTEDEIQYIDSNGNVMNQEEANNLVKYTLKVVDTLYDIGTAKPSKHGGNSQPVRSTIKLNSKESPNIEVNLTKYLAGKGVPKEQVEYMFDYMRQNNISEIGTLDLAEKLLFGLTQNVEIKEGFLTEIKYKKRAYDEGKAWSLGSYDYLINELNNARNLKKRTVGDTYHISASHRDEDTGKSFKIEEDSAITREGFFSKNKISVKTSYFVNGIEMTKEEFKKDLDEVTKERVEVVKSNRYKDLIVPGGTNYKEVEIKTPSVKAELKGHADFATDEGIGWYRVDDGEAGELRVLEMQSDMFQQRKDKDLSKSNLSSNKLYDKYLSETDKRKIDDLLEHRDSLIEHGEYSKDDEDAINADIGNIEKPYREKLQQTVLDKAFHQILNTDNKWVKFFIQSIVQNAQRNGYEKIKLPAGETVAKIEGYANFDKDNRANYEHNKNLDKEIFNLQSELNNADLSDQKRDSLQIKLSNLLSQRKDVKGGQSFSVMDFYQVRVQNTLKSLYGKESVKTVIDKYGNKWFEVELDSKRDSGMIMLQQQNGRIKGQADIEAGTVLINSLLQSQDTLPHEYAHHYIAWFRDTPIVQEAIKKWGSEEALVQAIGEQVVKQKGEAYGWWKKFTQWLQGKFDKLDKVTKEELKNLLTDSFLTRQNLKEDSKYTVYPKAKPDMVKAKYKASKQLNPKFKGKFILAHAGIGKSYAVQYNSNLIDGDDLFTEAANEVVTKYNKSLNEDVQTIPNVSKMKSIFTAWGEYSTDTKKVQEAKKRREEVYQLYADKAQQLMKQGKTILSSSARPATIKIADYVIVQDNTELIKTNLQSDLRINKNSETDTNKIKEKINKFNQVALDNKIPLIKLSSQEFLSDILYSKDTTKAKPKDEAYVKQTKQQEISTESKLKQLLEVYSTGVAPKIGGGLVEDVTWWETRDEDKPKATMMKGTQEESLKDMLPKIDGRKLSKYKTAVNAWDGKSESGIIKELLKLLNIVEQEPRLAEEFGWNTVETKPEDSIIFANDIIKAAKECAKG